MDLWTIVKFQIATHAHLNNINLSEFDLECLALLAINGSMELTDFCNIACKVNKRDKNPNAICTKEIFTSPQSARNCVNRLMIRELIEKETGYRNPINIHPNIEVQTDGNILLEMKFLRKDESEKG